MLTHLHVKNLAIVEDIEVEFAKNLNILTGETGVGKSIIIGSINIALGAKITSALIRSGAEFAFVEMIFEPTEEEWERVRKLDIYPEEGRLVISRKIMSGRSVSRINGETVTLALLKEVAGYFIDLHGQHEHQSLLNTEKHLEIVDQFHKATIQPLKQEAYECYHQFCAIQKERLKFQASEEERQREYSFLEYEKNEIDDANISEKEEEELEREFKRLANAEKLVENMGLASQCLCGGQSNAAALVSQALLCLQGVSEFDSELKGYFDTLVDLESIINDLNRDMAGFMDDFSFDPAAYNQIEGRLDYIRKILVKYGGDYETMIHRYKEIQVAIQELEDFELNKKETEVKYYNCKEALLEIYARLTDAREKSAKELQVQIEKELFDLNFNEVKFTIHIENTNNFSDSGVDRAEFMIATNPGEPIRPLVEVASGGELSRIMLAIKSVLAHNDSIFTLVFDEIDTGISGRTAQKVSEKLLKISRYHQVICITHLAQIASMADCHYVIEKITEKERTFTQIRPLSEDQSEEELARILGGAKITDSVLSNAKEMRELARNIKKEII